MKPRHLLMGAALVAAAGLVLFGETTEPDTEVAEPVERAQRPAQQPAAPVPAAVRAAQAADAGTILRLLPRSELIGEAGEAAFEGSDLFAGQNLNPPPPPPSEPSGPPPPPPEPTAPPLPFTVLGKALADGAYEVYLAQGERTYVVRTNMVIDGMYRVDAIAPPTLTLTYLPLKQVQQLNIGVMD